MRRHYKFDFAGDFHEGESDFNVVETTCLTVFMGCHLFVKTPPPTVSFRRDLV